MVNAQDSSRLALTESIVQRGSLNIDPYWRQTIDRAFADGHWYSDKAPGVSLLAIVPVAIDRGVGDLAGARQSRPLWSRRFVLWALRVWSGGLPLLGLAFLAGRVAEGLRRGSGAVAAVSLGVGTIAGSLAPTTFGHVPDALALFAAFVMATRAGGPRAYLLVGLLAGLGVLLEYPAALAALVLALYVSWRGGLRALLAGVAGALPVGLVLGAYDWIAFGAPWHLSYRYTDNMFTPEQHQGLFGIGAPSLHGLWTVLMDGRGLLVISPVLVAAAAGLVRLGRAAPAETLTAAGIAAVFVVSTAGYFLPDGGLSPGPRFATAAIPFCLLGLPSALERWPRVTLVLAAASVGLALFDELTWSVSGALRFVAWPATVWSLLGLSREAGAILFLAAGAAAALLAAGAFLRASPGVRGLR